MRFVCDCCSDLTNIEADKDGRCVVLPCRRGDELWTYCDHPIKRV